MNKKVISPIFFCIALLALCAIEKNDGSINIAAAIIGIVGLAAAAILWSKKEA
jgi:membrane associated rhomboid family serine protease